MSPSLLEVKLAGISFPNPVLLASGTVGYGSEIAEVYDLSRIGGIVTKSLSLKPRKGNPPQRVVETPSGMLNAIGLANVGVEEFILSKLPAFRGKSVHVICNIAAASVEEYVECVRLLTGEELITAFEINVSCPNVKDGGLEFGHSPALVGTITSRVKAVSTKPVFVKLSPNVSRISDFARVVKEEGGDAVSAVNTLVGTAFDIYTGKPKLRNVTGGLSGPAIKPVALAKVLEIKRNVDIPVIGIGGISGWQDAVEFMIAGASLVQVGTINFVNPLAAPQMVNGIAAFCKSRNIAAVSALTGSFNLGQ